MAGVNEVTYNHISSTEGWWNGDTPDDDAVTITQNNATYIYKDCEQGFTDITANDLDENIKPQAIKLNQFINSDEIEYTDDGTTNDGTTDETLDEENQKPKVSAGVASAAGGLAFGALTFAATEGMKLAMNSFTAPVVGSLDVALGAMSIANVALFDVEFSKRQAEFANADVDQSTMLDAEEELNQNIDDLETEPPEVENEGVIKEKVEEVETTDNELTDTIEDTSSVAKFLSEGNIIGALGIQNTLMLVGSAINSGKMIALAFLGVTPFTLANSLAGQALCAVATGLFSLAATAMAVKSGFELSFGSKGNEMLSEIEEIENNKPDVNNIVQENSPENATAVNGESSTNTGGNTATNPSAA